MIPIISVEDSFAIPSRGIVVSGVNSLLDNEAHDSIKSLIGECVRICRFGEDDLLAEVLEVTISESLIGKKNISILLADGGFGPIARGTGIFPLTCCVSKA
jgi:hypothetical protein